MSANPAQRLAEKNWKPDRDSLIKISGSLVVRVDVSSPAFPDVFTIVDPDIYESLMYKKKWTVTRAKEGGLYVRRNFDKKSTRLHRLITEAGKGLHVDHINGDSLDNRRANLRVCLPRQNAANSRSSSGVSRYKGVSKHCTASRPWKAQICVNRKSIHLGCFAIESDAALAYNDAALKYFGEFALLNRVE